MKYSCCVNGADTELSLDREGLHYAGIFLDYADIVSLRPVNHRVMIETEAGVETEVSMLGFSFDGFWEELTGLFGSRSLEALFVDESQIMLCEGEYQLTGESGRCSIALYPDSVCILPQTRRAVRVPLCYVQDFEADGYLLTITMRSGARYTIGRMGYDTMPFFERAMEAADRTKRKRAAALAATPLNEPFTEKGLFRTEQPDQYWNAAFGAGSCAVELHTGDDAATYLYRFDEPREVFLQRLEESMEAVGVHREMIYLTDEQLAQKPLYRMSADRTEAVRFLRARSAGRLIHNAGHAQKLGEFLSDK